jgi:shikimate kinase
MGYYDPHPTLDLACPLTLIGFVGSGAGRVGHGLAARTGLPLADLARDVEARVGMSRARILLEQGRSALRRLEADALRRALASKPSGIVVLGDAALLDPDSRQLVREDSHLVYIERPLAVLHQRVIQQCREAPGSIPEFMLAPPLHPSLLEPMLEERRPGYGDARTILHGGDLHALELVDGLMRALEARRIA